MGFIDSIKERAKSDIKTIVLLSRWTEEPLKRRKWY